MGVKIPKHIKNILFDMDDVLVFTRALDRKVKETIFAPLNLRWSQISPYTHLSIKEMLLKMFGDLNIKERPEKYLKTYFQEYNRLLAKSIKENTVPGVAELVKKLSKKNYRLALVTSSTLAQAKIVCRGLGLENLFEALVTAEDITHSKPHPGPYQKAIERLRVKPEECAVIEDLPTGIASAKATSPKVVVIAITTTCPKENLKKADFIIDSFNQIEV